jgi:hypothetical protein
MIPFESAFNPGSSATRRIVLAECAAPVAILAETPEMPKAPATPDEISQSRASFDPRSNGSGVLTSEAISHTQRF